MGCSRIEEVTRQACRAADEGRWDLVEQLYRERESELASEPLSGEERLRIVTLDRRVAEQALVARNALGALLQETAAQRQKIEELRRRIGPSFLDTGTILLQA